MDFKKILSDQREELDNLDLSALVPRMEERQINLKSKLAQVIIGVRRSGKSTLCQKVLLESGVKFGYVNFDDENFIHLTPEQLNEIIETLYRLHGPLDYLFFDEIQNIHEVWPLFINRLLRQGKHLIITGSNANLLSGELATHLTGRYHQIENFPFSFMEYCNLRGVDTGSHSSLSRGLRQKALDEYLVKGGMPEIVNETEYASYIKGLVASIVTKDICKRHHIRNVEAIRQLANLVLDLSGQEIQTSELARKVEMSQPTVANYLQYLKEAYLIREVPIFSYKNLDRQKLRKYYAIDVAFMSNHDYAFGSPNFGWRLETVVALELMRRINPESDRLFYLKKHKNFEVDFVVVKSSRIDELIQVTYDFSNPSLKLRNRELMGLVKGAEAVGCDNLTLIIMEGSPSVETIQNKKINIVKAADWLLKLD
ncbi:MAG: ATP-binding protein [Bacteroidales bacterium]|nr:ATP-binding protein [Bacteroidales bacterium]